MSAPQIRYFPDVLASTSFDELARSIEWDDRMRARRTASFGVPYDYSGQVYPAAPMPQFLLPIIDRAATLSGHGFNNCLCNFYASGESSMGFHQDSYAKLVPESAIAIASFGSPREIVFRSLDQTQQSRLVLTPGSILLMNRVTQQGWKHAVPPQPGAGPRISLTFRQFNEAAP